MKIKMVLIGFCICLICFGEDEKDIPTPWKAIDDNYSYDSAVVWNATHDRCLVRIRKFENDTTTFCVVKLCNAKKIRMVQITKYFMGYTILSEDDSVWTYILPETSEEKLWECLYKSLSRVSNVLSTEYLYK